VRGFWKVACRDEQANRKLTKGQDVIVGKAAQKDIAANVARMCPTSDFDAQFKNILECDADNLPTPKALCIPAWYTTRDCPSSRSHAMTLV
jgi:hypothetical protein